MKSRIVKSITDAFSSMKPNSIKRLCVFAFTFYVLLFSWNSDDAYHSYVMARHLADGNGLVYNVGYRVCASTCPLFTILEAIVIKLIGNAFYSGIILGTIFSGLTIYIIVFKICRKTSDAVCSTVILMLCYSFMCYTTAGLENSLLYLLGTLFLYVSFTGEDLSQSSLLKLSFLLSLIAMTRMDAVLLFIPLILFLYLRPQPVTFSKRMITGMIGLTPFLLWEVFSVFYYGYPFPNTFYIKLSTGFPRSEYITKGVDYLFRSFACDILLAVFPIVLIITSVRKRITKNIFLAFGIILYFVYVVHIGGDFMVGRHLTVPFLLSVAGVLYMTESNTQKESSAVVFRRQPLIFLCILGALWIPLSVLSRNDLFDRKENAAATSVADERRVYSSQNGNIIAHSVYLFLNSVNIEKKLYSAQLSEMQKAYEADAGGLIVTDGASGVSAFYGQMEYDNIYITDSFGLMDPLLSHLPAIHATPWRIGHMKRALPEGYDESLAAGENLIVDPSLHEFYDKVLLIVAGDLFDHERLHAILAMNSGQYDHLIDEYLERRIADSSIEPH